MRVDIDCPGALAGQGYLFLERGLASTSNMDQSATHRISAKLPDMVRYPVNRQALIMKSEISFPHSIAECEDVEPVVDCDDDNWLSKLHRICHKTRWVWRDTCSVWKATIGHESVHTAHGTCC